MKHHTAPAPGGAPCVPVYKPLPSLSRWIVIVIALLAAPAVTLAQVTVSVNASDPNAGETPADNGEFTIIRSGGDPGQPLRVDYSVGGSATSGADYAALPGSVMLGAGQTEMAVAVDVAGDDDILEGDETVVVTLVDGDDTDVSGDPATITIFDSPHSVSVSAGGNAGEGSGSSAFTVSLDGENQSGGDLSVQYSVGGTAQSPEDYSPLTGSVTIAVGASSATIDVIPVDDDLPEDAETVVITLTGTGNPQVAIGDPDTASLSIADNDVENTEVEVSISATDSAVGETPDDDGLFTVRRVGGDPERAVTVAYSVGGTASEGEDYAALSGSVSLGTGVPEATIPINVNGDDGVFEGNETVTITLSPEEGHVAVVEGTATVTIDDSAHSVTAPSSENASEDPPTAGEVTISLGARNESGADLTVSYLVTGTATPGTDYQPLSGTATIPLDSSSTTVEITPISDDLVDGGETVIITLESTSDTRAPVGTPSTATVSISDDDIEEVPEEVEVSVIADGDAAEAPPGNGRFLVQRAGGDMERAVTVSYSVGGTASPGSDYTALSGIVDLGAGEPDVAIDVDALADDLFEGDETVTVELLPDEGDVAVVQATATLTIQDSPHSVMAAAVADANENPVSAGRISVSLGSRNESGAELTVQYSVGGTATAGSDYSALSETVGIPVGASSATIEVTPIDDDSVEASEDVVITLTDTSNEAAPVGTPATASVSIADDDAEDDDDGDGLSNRHECPLIILCIDSDDDGLTNDQDPDDDGDGVPTANEGAPDQDTDDDGTPDYLDDDDDGDGRPTREEDANEDGDGNPATDPTDTDGDRIPDYLDADDRGGPEGDVDGDGLTNEEEADLGTDPERADTDGDGVNDGSEAGAGTDPLDNRAFADADGDLVPDAVEADDGTDPGDPNSFADGDGGGTANHVETVTYATFGLPQTSIADAADDRRDLDGDGLPDRLEIGRGSDADDADSPTAGGAADEDDNGITNAVEEYLAALGITSVDAVSDRDRDGYPDAAEVALGLNPLRAIERDSDGDGVPDVVEALAGIDIDGMTDSDGDGVPDAREIALGANPLDANSPVANGAVDDDGDGVSNAIEEVLRLLGAGDVDDGSDGDGDGIGDADEIRFGTDPFHDEQPAPWIELTQSGIGSANALLPDGGTATAIAVVGGHQAGTLVYDWSGSSDALLAVSSGGRFGRTLTIAPQTLPPGPYNLVLNVQREVGDYTSPSSTIELTVIVLESGVAADVADGDGDGVPDTADDADASAGLGHELQVQSGARMQAAPGIRLQLGSTARAARTASARVTINDIANAGDGAGEGVGNSEDAFDYVSGIYDFAITNLADVGSTAQVVIPQAAAIGEFAEYRKFRPDSGWTDFVEDDNNSVASAAGGPGDCPPPGDDSYQPGLAQGHSCVQLTIEDGGPNDGDAGLGPNGVIEDPGGVATPKGQVSVGQGSGSVNPVALLAIALATLLGTRRRRQNQAP